MRGWISKVVVALVVALLLLPGVSHALTVKQETLVGLKGVAVLVEALPPQIERPGLTYDQIQSNIELRLRKAGVKVLGRELNDTPGWPTLYVRVGLVSGSGHCAYSTHVALQEQVTLARGFKTYSSIWEADSVGGIVGIVGDIKTGNIMQIWKEVRDGVDIFINDYLAANPKK